MEEWNEKWEKRESIGNVRVRSGKEVGFEIEKKVIPMGNRESQLRRLGWWCVQRWTVENEIRLIQQLGLKNSHDH